MNTKIATATGLALSAMLAVPASTAAAQDGVQATSENNVNIVGELPANLDELPEGPTIKGMITARKDGAMRVRAEDGTSADMRIAPTTSIREVNGFLSLGRSDKTQDALLNGLKVDVETVQWGNTLVAKDVRFSNESLEMAQMIRNGTAQGFAEQTAATDALRSRVGDIDNYNVHSTTAVYFDTGEWQLSQADQRKLCQAAAQADSTENALLLVVGYTDSVGDQDYNQVLSERRAGRVVNFLQQECQWKPWRMLTPTGMAEADPSADNMSESGRAQNRRVEVSVLVSKAVEGL